MFKLKINPLSGNDLIFKYFFYKFELNFRQILSFLMSHICFIFWRKKMNFSLFLLLSLGNIRRLGKKFRPASSAQSAHGKEEEMELKIFEKIGKRSLWLR